MHLWWVSSLAWFAAAAASEPAPVEPPRVFLNDTHLANVYGEKLTEVSYVAAHCEALYRYLQFTIGMPELPPPVARIEIADLKNNAEVQVRLAGGQVLVVMRMQSGDLAPQRCAEAAATAWLARAAVAGGKPVDAAEPWTKQLLVTESLALLRPALVDLWFREGLTEPVASVADILQGRAPDREVFLFWRALRREGRLTNNSEVYRLLINAAQGQSVSKFLATLTKDPEAWWLLHRAELLHSRPAVSLGMSESAKALDDMSRFVFDIGQGDVVLSGPELVAHRQMSAIKTGMETRLTNLRREILRQNPVYHNAWRLLGLWLERFATATPAELDKIWADYLIERTVAEELRREVAEAMEASAGKK